MIELLQNLPLLRLHFVFRALDELRLEGFTGSTWHGALGHALARLAPEAFDLLYSQAGQDRGTPRPFVLLPEQTSQPDLFACSVTLLGEAVALAPVVVLAAENLAAVGLGNRQVPLRLVRVACADAGGVAREAMGESGLWHEAVCQPLALSALAAPWVDSAARAIRLQFTTRLRLKSANGVLRSPPSLTILMQRLLERVSTLSQHYGAGALPSATIRALLADARAGELADSSLRWAEWSRTSGRTGQVMPWGGLVGEVTYQGELAALLPWLALGEWLHVGSKTSFGLGHFRLWAAPR